MDEIIYTFDSPRSQNFSIPSNIIYFINRDTVYPRSLEKLQQTCKYLFAKNKVVIVENGYFADFCWPKLKMVQKQENFAKFNAKFLLLRDLEICALNRILNITKDFCSKIYQNNITSLNIRYTALNLSEFKILTASKMLNEVNLQYSVVLNSDKTTLPLDEILKPIPNIKNFFYHKSVEFAPEPDVLTNKTLENMITFLNGLESFSIVRFILSRDLDTSLFCKFIKNSAAPKAYFSFYFQHTLIEQQKQITQAVDEMLENWDFFDHENPNIFISHYNP